MDKLTRLYDRLTADERLRAFYEAAANKDPAEMDKLNATCPRRTYTMDDYAYTRSKINMLVIAIAARRRRVLRAERIVCARVQCCL
jgi:hypothetical protein